MTASPFRESIYVQCNILFANTIRSTLYSREALKYDPSATIKKRVRKITSDTSPSDILQEAKIFRDVNGYIVCKMRNHNCIDSYNVSDTIYSVLTSASKFIGLIRTSVEASLKVQNLIFINGDICLIGSFRCNCTLRGKALGNLGTGLANLFVRST